MATKMRDWLGEVVEQELGDALNWLRRAKSPEALLAAPNLPSPNANSSSVREFTVSKDFENLYSDDGSNLRVRYVRSHSEDKIVQLQDVS